MPAGTVMPALSDSTVGQVKHYKIPIRALFNCIEDGGMIDTTVTPNVVIGWSTPRNRAVDISLNGVLFGLEQTSNILDKMTVEFSKPLLTN